MAEPRIAVPTEAIAAFCRKWRITELALFGSVLREDFRPDSDIDVLVTFAEGVTWGFRDRLAMEAELAAIFGRAVDLGDRRWVEQTRNPYRRNHILKSAVTVYAA